MEKEIQKNKFQSTFDSDSVTESIKKLEYKGEFYGEIPYFIGVGSWTSPSSEVEEEEINEGNLTAFESAIIISALEDAIDELSILKYIIGAPAIYRDLNYKSPKERYTRRLTPIRIHPEAETRPVLTSAIKLQRDRESVEAVFCKLLKSLLEERNYSPLSNALENLRRQEEDDNNLIHELRRNLIYLNDLKRRVEEKRKNDETEEKERDEFMYKLQDELDDVILKCELEEKFTNTWENVRNAQNVWKLNLVENYLKDNISKFTTKTKMEKRVTYEMQMFLKACQTELEEQLEEWMSRYDSEMERRENKIIKLKYDRDQAEERKHSLKKLSWWRGLMVRKKLGPYKPKKQKEKPAGKKK